MGAVGVSREQVANRQAGRHARRQPDKSRQPDKQPEVNTIRWLGIPPGRQTGTRQPDGQFPEADRH